MSVTVLFIIIMNSMCITIMNIVTLPEGRGGFVASNEGTWLSEDKS